MDYLEEAHGALVSAAKEAHLTNHSQAEAISKHIDALEEIVSNVKNSHMNNDSQIRINNIEFRIDNDSNTGEFISWGPNQLYGRLQQYLDNGWEDKGTFIRSTEPYGHTMSKGLFEKEETCYVVAFLRYNKKEDVCELTTVGDRLLYIKSIEDFMQVYHLADKKMMEAHEHDD